MDGYGKYIEDSIKQTVDVDNLDLLDKYSCDSPTVITPDNCEDNKNVSCFLAGGISDCYNWQNCVIRNITSLSCKDLNKNNLIIYNPRRDVFDISNKAAATNQIEWEFRYLKDMDIFSMYFVNSTSQQPICFYELGRYIPEMKRRFPYDYYNRIVISVESGFKREQDVLTQLRLALGDTIFNICVRVVSDTNGPLDHAKRILNVYEYLCNNYKGDK